MNWILQNLVVEVCMCPSLTRGSYPDRTMIFAMVQAGPSIERWFFQRPGSGRQMKGDFSNGSGRVGKKEMSSGRAGPGPKKSARADL